MRRRSRSPPLVRSSCCLRAGQRLAEALAVERLQQVVERVHVERPQRVAVVGGDEHDERHLVGADGVDHVEAVRARHLHVEEHQVGLQRHDRLGAGGAVAGLADDLEARLVLQQRADAARARAVRRRRPGRGFAGVLICMASHATRKAAGGPARRHALERNLNQDRESAVLVGELQAVMPSVETIEPCPRVRESDAGAQRLERAHLQPRAVVADLHPEPVAVRGRR